MEQSFYYASPLGTIEVIIENTHILSIEFSEEETHPRSYSNEIFDNCKLQLDDYFAGTAKEFDLPLYFNGTSFQNKVWKELTEIPYGKTISYLELATRIGNPKAVRAVGTTNGKNPFVIVVPCHRVIGKNGTLTGYGGGLWRKEWLLEHEIKHSPHATTGIQLSLFTEEHNAR